MGNNNFLIYLHFIGGVLAFLLGIVRILNDTTRLLNWFRAGFMIALGILIFKQYNLELTGNTDAPVQPPFAMILLVGPFMYFSFQDLLRENFHLPRNFWMHFVPALISFVVYGTLLIFENLYAWNMWPQVFQLVDGICVSLFHYTLIIYGVLSFSKSGVFGAYDSQESKGLYFLAITIMGIVCLFIIVYMLSLVTGMRFFHHAYGVLVSSDVLLLLIYHIASRGKKIIRDGEPPEEKEAPVKGIAYEVDDSAMQKKALKLKALMEDEKLYYDEDLTLNKVADHMEISGHQLSQLLNNNLKVGFKNLINHYRIEEAKRMIEAHPERPIMNIAYQVGFNSKSVFYKAFSRHGGMTPTQFKESLEKEPKA